MRKERRLTRGHLPSQTARGNKCNYLLSLIQLSSQEACEPMGLREVHGGWRSHSLAPACCWSKLQEHSTEFNTSIATGIFQNERQGIQDRDMKEVTFRVCSYAAGQNPPSYPGFSLRG